jgi:predicted nuclease of restriction endonuclease-like (RecB) superfamily
MNKDLTQNASRLLRRNHEILEEARHKVYRTANTEMLRAYWSIGREIVEEEQKGKDRAAYGSALLEELARRLTELYGKSYSSRHLRYMRQFYREFPKWNAVRSELSWTHYRMLLKVKKEETRKFYMMEAITGNWSTRQLEQNTVGVK